MSKSLTGTDRSAKVLLIIILCLLAAVIALVIWQQRRRLRIKHMLAGGTADGGAFAAPRTSKEWRQQAFYFKDQGSFASACRYLHRACLQLLDEANLIVFAPARSNFEYAISLSRLSLSTTILPAASSVAPNSLASGQRNLRQVFQSFSHTVDAIYFGDHPAGEAEFQFCLKCLQEIEGHLGADAVGQGHDHQ